VPSNFPTHSQAPVSDTEIGPCQFNKNLILVIAVLLAGCSDESNLDAPKKFFARNKIGSSPDYAVMKSGMLTPGGNDHVITVHGYSDDLAVCLITVKALKEDAPNAEFNCVPLNH
jgi:hypothetical protein